MKHRINILLFAIALTLLSLFFADSPYYYGLVALIAAVFLFVLSLGVLLIRFNYFLVATNRMPGTHCLLTFDDGPDPDLTPKILDILAKHEIKAFFFVIGQKAEAHPAICQRILQEGHGLGNHSYSHHPFMSLFSKKRLHAELTKSQEVFRTLFGKKAMWFRPPIGYTNPNYASVLRKMGLRTMGWTLRSYDSVLSTPEKLHRRLITRIRPGQIVLLHDNLAVSTKVLDGFISEAKTNGIFFATETEIQQLLHA